MTEQPPTEASPSVTGDNAPAEPLEVDAADVAGEPGAEGEPEPKPTPEEVAAQEEAQHAHFLSTYEPVLTRLPDALGTAPEQEYVPADADEEHDGE